MLVKKLYLMLKLIRTVFIQVAEAFSQLKITLITEENPTISAMVKVS